VDAGVSDHFPWLYRDITISDIRLKRRAGKGLSQDARKERDMELSPAEEKLVARQVNVMSVGAHVMVVVCAWMQVLVTIVTDCAETLQSVTFGSNKRPRKG